MHTQHINQNEYRYDTEGNATRKSFLFVDRAGAAEALCMSQDALRKAGSKKLHLTSERYPEPLYIKGFGKVLYRRSDVAKAAINRGLEGNRKSIDVYEEFDYSSACRTTEDIARLLCCTEVTFIRALKKNNDLVDSISHIIFNENVRIS